MKYITQKIIEVQHRGMPKKCLHVILLCCCIGVHAQHLPVPDSMLWLLVEQQLDQRTSDTSFQFLLPIVRTHCGQDANCLLRNLNDIMVKLEHERFQLPAAIFVAKEITRIARQEHSARMEAKAYMDIGRYYHALGERAQAIVAIDKALVLAQGLKDTYRVTQLKLLKIQVAADQQKIEDFIPEMNALLAEVVAIKDTQSIEYMHTILMSATIEAGKYDESTKHIAYVEKIPVSEPLTTVQFHTLARLNRGKAMLAEAKNNPEEAVYFYQELLRLAEHEPDLWIETHTLFLLSKLEWKRSNAHLAKSYLLRAQNKAENLKLDDLLVMIFELKAEIAEAEGDSYHALRYLKKKYLYEARLKDKNAGFDLRNYNLQLEKEQLATENKNRNLQLQLKNTQLRSVLIGTSLIVLLAASLFVGLRLQRKQKLHLAKQNGLIQQQAEQLKSLDAAKSRFFANVSHELRTPLTLLLGPVHTLLKEKNWTDKQKRLLTIASQSGKQLEQLIGEILDLRKLESGNLKIDETATETRTFFISYLAQFETLAEHKQIHYSYTVDAANGPIIHIDQAKCRQILYNLLSNAFKFTPQQGSISAEASIWNGQLMLRVADTGRGIHPDDLPHVFDRFFQTSRPDKPMEGGTGIGLHLCQEYTHLFGGKIEVSSTEGKGSVFCVQFPVRLVEILPAPMRHPAALDTSPDEEDRDVAQAPILSVLDQSRPTVLVVEDVRELQDYLRMMLSEKYQVVTAENGREANAWLAEQCRTGKSLPALILSDLMMPVMNGYQLLEKLKSDDTTRHIPVIMLTARADMQDKLKALRIGVDDYLLKPFDEDELMVRIENLLRNQHIRLEYGATEPEPAEKTLLLSDADRIWLETFEAYVRQHMASDLLTVSVLAHRFTMSESTLLRQLKRLTGLSPQQYIQAVRLHEARTLLENGAYKSIAQVALKTGYDDPRYFSRIFRQQFGKSPSDILVD